MLASVSFRCGRGQRGLNDEQQLERVLVLMARFKDYDISMQIQRLVIDLRKSAMQRRHVF
jgi:hypothetical protein